MLHYTITTSSHTMTYYTIRTYLAERGEACIHLGPGTPTSDGGWKSKGHRQVITSNNDNSNTNNSIDTTNNDDDNNMYDNNNKDTNIRRHHCNYITITLY